jgi:hypothetical protein
MASSFRYLNPGSSTVFTTRVVGQQTRLFAIAWPIDPGSFLPTLSWHKELCCESDHIERSVGGPIDISAAGALVTVRNIQSSGQIRVWTDYI